MSRDAILNQIDGRIISNLMILSTMQNNLLRDGHQPYNRGIEKSITKYDLRVKRLLELRKAVRNEKWN